MEEKEDDAEKEKAEYFYRMICLVVDLGTEILLKLFFKDIPQGQTVKAFLNSKANVLNILKNKKVLNDIQIGIVNAASPDVSRFDISLLYILISNLTNIQSPTGGWYISCPIPSDRSAGALLMNLRRVRNEVIAHSPRGKMKKPVFEKYWNEAKDILIVLAGEVGQAEKESIKEKIDKTKVKQLLWAMQDKNGEIVSSLEEVIKKNDQQSKVLEDIKSSVQTNTDKVKTNTDQLKTNTDQVKTNTDQLKTNTDQLKTNTNQLKTNTDQVKTNTDQLKTNTDQLKTLTDVIRQIPETSSGTETLLPEMIYTRPKTRVAGKPVPKKAKSGAKRVKKSQEDNQDFASDLKDSEYFMAKTKLRAEIIDHYEETGCSTTSIPALMDGEEVHIDRIFVMPSMRTRKDMSTGRDNVTQFTRKEYEDVMTGGITTIHELFQKDGKTIRRICISGDAGQGKTTLCRKIVSTWCKVHGKIENVPNTEHQFLKSFDLLFYLPLRNNKLSDIIEMIETDIVRKASRNVLKDFLEKESEKCLIILDGLDEWLPSEDCKHKVPYIDLKEKFTVLITSRPWKLEVLRLKMSEIGQEVELNWIKSNKLIEAVVNFLNNKYAKERNWRHFKYIANTNQLNETYRKVEYLAEVPVILTQMLCMWYDDETFGNTRVEIYSNMLDYLFHVAEKRDQDIFDSACMRPQRSTNNQLLNVFTDLEYCKMNSEILCKLSDLAYNTLFNKTKENALVFPHSVTEISKLTEKDIQLCLKVGILSQTKRHCKASKHTKSISFLHKTFQEFLAALYIAYGGKVGSVNVMLSTFESLDDVFEMSQVFIFLSGLMPDLIGDMSHHIAQLTDKDERVLQYRNSNRGKNMFSEPPEIIVRLQDIIYDCIFEVPEHKMSDNKVELHDVSFSKPYYRNADKPEKIIPYLNLENVKSVFQTYDEPSEYWTQLNDLVMLDIRIRSQQYIDPATSAVERCASSLTCLSFNFRNTKVGIIHIDNLLTAFKKVSHLTCVKLDTMELTHSDLGYLGTTLSQSTQLKEIRLSDIQCRTCQWGHCNNRINLSHHKQLQYLSMGRLDGDIVLSNEVPLEYCEIWNEKCELSIIDTLKFSTHLYELLVMPCDQILLYDTKIITSSTTTVKDDEREVHPTPLCLYKLLIDVIPTLKNLRRLEMNGINLKQDILRLSPEMTRLDRVDIANNTMTLQCLHGLIDSLPKTEFDVIMENVSICPQEDTYTALQYITDRYQITFFVYALSTEDDSEHHSDYDLLTDIHQFTTYVTENGRFSLKFTNIPAD